MSNTVAVITSFRAWMAEQGIDDDGSIPFEDGCSSVVMTAFLDWLGMNPSDDPDSDSDAVNIAAEVAADVAMELAEEMAVNGYDEVEVVDGPPPPIPEIIDVENLPPYDPSKVVVCDSGEECLLCLEPVVDGMIHYALSSCVKSDGVTPLYHLYCEDCARDSRLTVCIGCTKPIYEMYPVVPRVAVNIE
jgi:hypothetical protein